jgi:type IV pilus assembly protein PilN
MANFNELSGIKQWAAALGVAALITGALYFTLFKSQREAENYKRRVDVIDQLRAAQAGPVNLLNTIGQTVNSTEAVWLNSMKDQGTSVDIDGMALSNDAVASLIFNLQKTGYFTNIEIKETYQDDTFKEMQAFNFTLTCEKAKS